MPANSTSTHLPVPGDDEITRLLQAVWDALDEAERWPTFETIDRAFWVQHRVDAAKLIARIPQVLLHGGRPQGGALPAAAGELSLTVAGAAACDGTEQVLQVVVAAARLAADAYLSGDPAEPGVTFDQVVAHLGVEVPPEDERELARRSGMLLVQEPWRVQTNVNESGWTIKVDRGIRPYAGVETVEQYWRARQEQLTWMLTTAAAWFIVGFAVFRASERIARRRGSLSMYRVAAASRCLDLNRTSSGPKALFVHHTCSSAGVSPGSATRQVTLIAAAAWSAHTRPAAPRLRPGSRSAPGATAPTPARR